MKKVLTIVMAVVMLLSLVGCSTQEAAPAPDEATKEETAANAGVAVEGVSFADNPNLRMARTYWASAGPTGRLKLPRY